MEHRLEQALLRRPITIDLVGVGGTGAQLLSRLARLHVAMRELGNLYGLHVRAFDSGRVRAANIGRQLFAPSDVGQYKSIVTVNRINPWYGLGWEAFPHTIQEHWTNLPNEKLPDMLISCVDTRAARRDIHRELSQYGKGIVRWLDLGNTERGGQVVLGQPHSAPWPAGSQHDTLRLPTVTELFPDLLDETIPDDSAPSCSVRLSLASQGLFVNDMAAVHASQLLYELFTRGELRYHGVIFDLDDKRSGPIPIDPNAWARFGLIQTPGPTQQGGCETA